MKRLFFLVSLSVLVLKPDAYLHAATNPLHHKKNIEDQNLIPALQPIVATYDIYIGGIHLLTADVLFEEGAHTYHARLNGQTYGVVYKVFPWNTELDAEGRIKNDQLMPTEYATHDVWGQKSKTMKLHFSKGNIVSEYNPPEEDKNPLPPDQRVGALDPITALLQMLAHVALTNNCNVSVPVFDGKRRFDVTAKDTGSEYIDEDDYGVYKGVAHTCDASFKQVAGEWTEKIKSRFWKKADNGEDREPFHVWLAQIEPSMPQLAVRIETGSVWGDVIMHLTKWRPATAADRIEKTSTAINNQK